MIRAAADRGRLSSRSVSAYGARLKNDKTLLIGFGVAITGSCGALAYMGWGGAETTITIVVGLAGLLAGQVVLLLMLARQNDNVTEKLDTLSHSAVELRTELRGKLDQAFTRIDEVRSETKSRTDSVIGGISDLKTSYSALSQSLAERVANPPDPQPMMMQQPMPRMQHSAQPMILKPALTADHDIHPIEPKAKPDTGLAGIIQFALEPVVDLRNQATAHYRLHASMKTLRGEITGGNLFEQLSHTGLRPELDLLSVQEVLKLLPRLRQRDPDLCILMPIGPETLSDRDQVVRIVMSCLETGAIGKGLVLELRHSTLPQMTPAGLEGLAQLSRQGHAFAMADASPGALDLSAMKTLNVKLVELDAGKVRQMGGFALLAEFAQRAEAMGITIIMTHVTDADMIVQLPRVSSLACGLCFAAPRRLKRAGVSPVDKLGQAA